MYFEPSKKTTYRFPSAQSVAKLDNRMYFPKKPDHAKEASHYDYNESCDYMPEREHYYD